jgi:L-alanine-DL-glutamate epimerase-like enolase superfamily enzyme
MDDDTKPVILGHIEAIPVDLPLHAPINLGGRLKLTVAEHVVTRVETRDGLVGWGCSAAAPNLSGELSADMTETIRGALAPRIIGRDAIDGAQSVGGLIDGHPAAKAALELGLLDLAARARGVPLHALLGRAVHSTARAMWMVGTASVEEDEKEASEKFAAGYRVFKVKVGSRPLEQDIAAVSAVRGVVGDGAVVSADANGTMDVERAIAFGRAAAGFNLANLEQPVSAKDVAGMARLAAAVPMPVCADEGIAAQADIETHAAQKAAAGASLKPIKLAGLLGTRTASQRCAALGWKINLACKVAESGLAAAGLLHLAATIEKLDWSFTATNHYLAADILRRPLTPRGDRFDVPAGIGLGVEVDPAAVAEFRRKSA